MSKTLFNTDTFVSKNVTNNPLVSNLKVETLKASSLTATTIINTELQAATTGVATNASAISTNTSAISTNTSAISTNTSDISTNTSAISTNTSAISTNTSAISENTTAIAGKADIFTASSPLNLASGSPDVLTVSNTSSATSGSTDLITSGGVFTGLAAKQETLSVSNGIQINSNELSLTGSYTGDFEISSNLSIAGYTDVAAALDAAGTTYTAETNGGLAVNASGEFSLDFTNTNADIDITQQVIISSDSAPQLLITPDTDYGKDAVVAIRGARDSSTTQRQARLRFQNFDSDDDTTNFLGQICGMVTDATNNYGGLVFDYYSNGQTQVGAMTMSSNGNFNIGNGTSFQDSYKFQVNGECNFEGSSYVREGLILDPVTMSNTTFTNGDDNNVSGSSLDNIYIKFAPSSTVSNDFVYLKNIGTSNAGHLTFDFFDNADDTRFSIRNIQSVGADPNVVTEVFDVFSGGVTAHTSIYRIPQMVFYNFSKASMSGDGKWGLGHFFDTLVSTRTTGAAFSSHSSGSITISQNGYYRIRLGGNPVTYGYNNRVAFCLYLNIDGTDYFEDEDFNFHGYTYTRNNTDGAFGNINFEDFIYIASGDIIQVRCKLDINNRSFDDTLQATEMDCFCNLQIERIAETNIT